MDRVKDFEALFNYATVGILATNGSGNIIMVNPFLLSQFGYAHENELIGQKVEMLIPGNSRQKHVEHRENYNKNPANRPMGVGRDLQGVKKDGNRFPVEISLSYYIKNERQYAFAFVTDISHRKQIEKGILFLNDQLQEAATELEARVEERTYELTETIQKLDLQIKETEEAKLNLQKSERELQRLLSREKELGELKSRFVSIASHEFRTPLSSILSSVYLLSKYTSAEDQSKRDKHIDRITSSVTLLTDILNDFLSLGKIEEGKIEVHDDKFNLHELLDNLLFDMQSILKDGQCFSYEHNGETIATLDITLLKHIAMNLISNAIKFSPENTAIEITSAVANKNIKLTVKDKGIGISKEDQQHLYERFYRASNAVHIQGTGLGLHIINKYIEMMDGTIACNSEPGKGTEFIVNFTSKKWELEKTAVS